MYGGGFCSARVGSSVLLRRAWLPARYGFAQSDPSQSKYAARSKDIWRSRAAYKLIELNMQHNLLKPRFKVIDLGSAPGGWSQIIAKEVGATPSDDRVVSVDVREMNPIDGVQFV